MNHSELLAPSYKRGFPNMSWRRFVSAGSSLLLWAIESSREVYCKDVIGNSESCWTIRRLFLLETERLWNETFFLTLYIKLCCFLLSDNHANISSYLQLLSPFYRSNKPKRISPNIDVIARMLQMPKRWKYCEDNSLALL